MKTTSSKEQNKIQSISDDNGTFSLISRRNIYPIQIKMEHYILIDEIKRSKTKAETTKEKKAKGISKKGNWQKRKDNK